MQELLLRDWAVVAVDLEQSASAEARIAPIAGDVTQEQTWDRAMAAAATLGVLTGVVNNAGIQGSGGKLVDTELAEHRRVVSVNVDSTFLGVRAGLRHLQRGGSVVNIASNAASRGVPRYGSYVAAKHAVVGLTRTAALEGARKGIRVNAVCPGPTQTRIMDAVSRSFSADDPDEITRRMQAANPSGRFADPLEVARAVAWLLGDEASYVNGASLAVDGGLTSA
ncbi:MAG: hypothetical protein JWM02_2946 [Frankiales bacterium]|nr:hypothetical protein [Frankiales bacterium]